jgi:hypothetical protein
MLKLLAILALARAGMVAAQTAPEKRVATRGAGKAGSDQEPTQRTNPKWSRARDRQRTGTLPNRTELNQYRTGGAKLGGTALSAEEHYDSSLRFETVL